MAEIRDAAPFAIFYAALFLALGVLLPFWPVFLEYRGLTGAQIGVVLALGTWAKALGNPALGRLADASARPRLVLIGLAALALLGTCLVPLADSFWTLLATYVLIFSAFQALIPLGDSRALAVAAARNLDYGRMRLWGSLAFLIAVLGMGEILDARGPHLLPPVLVAAFVALLITAAFLPEPKRQSRESARSVGFAKLLRDRYFTVFLLVGALLQASHAVYYGFSAVHWTAAGLSPATVGWLWAEGVIAEILLFAVSNRVVGRVGPIGLLGLAAAGGVIRWSVLAGTTALPALAAIQVLHAVTFGAAHLGAMHFIARQAPEGAKATAQGVYTAAAGGVGMGIAMLGAGALYDAVAGKAFLAMAVMSLLAGALTMAITRIGRLTGRAA